MAYSCSSHCTLYSIEIKTINHLNSGENQNWRNCCLTNQRYQMNNISAYPVFERVHESRWENSSRKQTRHVFY